MDEEKDFKLSSLIFWFKEDLIAGVESVYKYLSGKIYNIKIKAKKSRLVTSCQKWKKAIQN